MSIKFGMSKADKLRAAYSDALVLKSGIYLPDPAPGAVELRGLSVADILRDLLQHYGETSVFSMDLDSLFKRALSTTNFKGILDDVVNAAISQGYNEAITTFELWTTKGTSSDFKPSQRVRIGGVAGPERIPENGSFKYADVYNESVSVQLSTDGISWGFSRQCLINDDIGLLTSVPRRFAAAFKRKINRLCYEALASINYAGNGRLMNYDSALNSASLADARALLRKQKSVGNLYSLNLDPKFLIVPTALETSAYQLINSTADPSGTNSGVKNFFNSGSLQIICDSALDDAHAKYNIASGAWYLASAPSQVDGIEVSYLGGSDKPIIESCEAFNSLSVDYRMYLDFTVDVVDDKGYIKNNGI